MVDEKLCHHQKGLKGLLIPPWPGSHSFCSGFQHFAHRGSQNTCK